MFKTREDFARAMLDGGRFKTHKGHEVYWDSGFMYKDKKGVEALVNWYLFGQVTEVFSKKKWTDDLPRWCRLQDAYSQVWCIGKVDSYEKDHDRQYISGGMAWRYAQPLSNKLSKQLDKEEK